MNLLKEALENQQTNSVDFVEDIKMNLYAKEIFVFTPKGEIKSLPKGATSLDFAFSIHSAIGVKTRGTRVNGKLVPLNYELKSGDQVEVITSANQKPTAHWLDFVTTSRAKNKIRSVLNENTKKTAEEGKEILTRKLRHLKITLNENSINELVNFFKLKTSLDLYYRIGIGSIENQQLKEFAALKSNSIMNFFKNKIKKTPNYQPEEIQKDELSSNYDMLVFGIDQDKLDYKLSNCCSPIPGDDVFGFVTINEGIKVHKKDCPNAISMQSNYAYRIILARWIDSSQQEFKATLDITGMDTLGLTNELTKVISNNMSVNIQSISLSGEAGIFFGQVSVIVPNNTILKNLIEDTKLIVEDFNTVDEFCSFVAKGDSFEAEDNHHDDLVMTLVLFAWMTSQPYFKDFTNLDIRRLIYEEQIKRIEEDLTPFGMIDDGLVADDDDTMW